MANRRGKAERLERLVALYTPPSNFVMGRREFRRLLKRDSNLHRYLHQLTGGAFGMDAKERQLTAVLGEPVIRTVCHGKRFVVWEDPGVWALYLTKRGPTVEVPVSDGQRVEANHRAFFRAFGRGIARLVASGARQPLKQEAPLWPAEDTADEARPCWS